MLLYGKGIMIALTTNLYMNISARFTQQKYAAIIKTNNINIVKTCQDYFNFEMPSTLWTKRSTSFDNKFLSCQNVFL